MCDFATCREITSHFEHSQKNLADQVVTFIAEMCNTPLIDCSEKLHLRRHALFLQSRFRELKEEEEQYKKTNHSQPEAISEDFAMSLMKYVESKLCLKKQQDEKPLQKMMKLLAELYLSLCSIRS